MCHASLQKNPLNFHSQNSTETRVKDTCSFEVRKKEEGVVLKSKHRDSFSTVLWLFNQCLTTLTACTWQIRKAVARGKACAASFTIQQEALSVEGIKSSLYPAPLAFLQLFQNQITVLGQIHNVLNLECHCLQSQSSQGLLRRGQSCSASSYWCSPKPRNCFPSTVLLP